MSHQTPEACKFSACECAERVPDIFAFKNICIKRQKHVRPSDADSEAARRNILPVGRTGRGGGRGGGLFGDLPAAKTVLHASRRVRRRIVFR